MSNTRKICLSTVREILMWAFQIWCRGKLNYDACMRCVDCVVRTYLLLWCMSEVCGGCGEDLPTAMMHVWVVWRVWWGPIYCYDAFMRYMEGVSTVVLHVWGVWRVWWGHIYCYDACLRCMVGVMRTYILLWWMSEVCGRVWRLRMNKSCCFVLQYNNEDLVLVLQ